MKFLKDKPLKEKLAFVGSVLLFSYLIIGSIDAEKKRKEMKTKYCYSYVITEGKRYVYRQGMSVDYYYYVKGKKYESVDRIINDDVKVNGGIYRIKLHTKDFGFGEVDYSTLIKDTSNFCFNLKDTCCDNL